VRELIREGIDNAPRYGLQSEIAICKYIHLLILFGSGFQTRPPWDQAFQENLSRVDLDPHFDELYDALIGQAVSQRT
jgi:hypothetical protein